MAEAYGDFGDRGVPRSEPQGEGVKGTSVRGWWREGNGDITAGPGPRLGVRGGREAQVPRASGGRPEEEAGSCVCPSVPSPRHTRRRGQQMPPRCFCRTRQFTQR